MDEYIKREPLIEEISSLSVTLCGSEIFGTLAKHSVVKMIYEQPTADVAEVKHGWWLQNGMCSECLVIPETSHKSYCPNCGTKMDR